MILEECSNYTKGNSIAIWGTGAYGAMAVQALNNEFGVTPDYFVDTNEKNHGGEFLGIKIISPKDIKRACIDDVYLFTLNIESTLNHYSYELSNCRIISPVRLLRSVDFSKVENKFSINRLATLAEQLIAAVETYLARNSNRNGVRVNSIDVVLTQRCTLKCEDCSNLMQYYHKPKEIERSQILSSLQCLVGHLDYVHEFRIIGGEPLLNKDLVEIVNFIADNFGYGYVVIYTNGTLLPSNSDVKHLSSIKNLSFKISDYGRDLSKRCKELEDMLLANNIHTIREPITEWQDSGTIVSHNRGDHELARVFGQCCVHDCYTLMGENLYICPFSANLYELDQEKYFFIERFAIQKLIDLDKSIARRALMDFLGSHKYLSACNFCNGRDHNVPKVQAAVQRRTPKQ
jgi:organic radical activating enzyme